MEFIKMSVDGVREVFEAGREVILQNGQLMLALKEDRRRDAIKIKHHINRVKSRILDKYDVIL